MIEQDASVRNVGEDSTEFNKLAPQIKIYNRYFYLKHAKQQDLQEEVKRQIQELASKPKLTPNSYVVLVQKLEQQLSSLLQKHMQGDDSMDFQHFQQIFNQFSNFSNIRKENEQFEIELALTQFWLILVSYDLQEQRITQNKFISLMHILFCPYSLKASEMTALMIHAFPDLESNRIRYCEEFPQSCDEIQETEALIKLWLKIKRNHLCSFSQEKKELVKNNQPSFRPEISMKTRQYAKKQLQKYLSNNRLDNIKTSKLNELSGYISGGGELSYHDLLYKRALQKEQILKTSREQISEGSDKSKKLTAEQTKKLVQNLYIIKEKRQDLDYSKIKEDQELKLCTFEPAIIEYHKKNTTPAVKNYSKEVDRLQKARKDKQKLQQAYDSLGRVKSNISGPPSMVEREKPKLILQIKVGDRLVKLKLKGDEDPRIVAKKFVIKYNLDESMQEVLEEVVSEQLATL